MKNAIKLLATASTLAVVASPALAQESSDSSSAVSPEEDSVIVVTAQKRAQDIQDVPISISAFGDEFIEDKNVQNLADIALYTPNFTIASSGQQTNTRINIRGIGSAGNNAIEPSVGVFIDGVYFPRPGSVIGNLSDVQSVEVLRGPQGTLFGRNTPVGALNITTKAPTSYFELESFAGYGNYNAIDVGVAVSGPIAETLSARIAARYTDRDGFGENTFGGGLQEVGAREDFSLRGKLLFEPNDALSITLAGDYVKLDTGGSVVEVLTGTENATFLGTLLTLYGDTVSVDDTFDRVINQDNRDILEDEQGGVSLDATYEFDNGLKLRSITAYRDWQAYTETSALRLPADILPRFTRYDTNTFSQELQIISPSGGPLEYVAGAFYYKEEYTIDESFDAGVDFCTPTVLVVTGSAAQAAACDGASQSPLYQSFFNQDLESFAVFGQATYALSDALSVTGGLRWTKDSKVGSFEGQNVNPFAGLFRANDVDTGLERDDSDLTWLVNAQLKPTDDVMIYASVSTGFKSGGFNSQGAGVDLDREDRIFAPETTTNYEIGVKTSFLNDDATFNVAIYRLDLSNFQDRSFDGGSSSFFVRNAGSLRHQGVEIDYSISPIEQLSITGGASYLDSEYLEFSNASPLPGGPPQDLAGARRTFSPKWQASNIVQWEDQIGSSGLSWFIRGEWQYVGDQNVGANSNNNPQSIQSAYSLFNAGAGIEDEDAGWSVDFWARNIGDKGYCTTIFDQPLGGPLRAITAATNSAVQRCVVGAPFTFGGRFRIKI